MKKNNESRLMTSKYNERNAGGGEREQSVESKQEDSATIAALSTARGRSAVAVIRLSGKDSLTIVKKLLTGEKSIQDRVSVYGVIDTGSIKDDVMITYFAAPKSYTGEDVVEISCHGSTVIVDSILRFVIDNGARAAERGEFTRRAFENGKLDLTKAEGVIDLIDAQCESAARAAYDLASGALKEKIDALSNNIAELTAQINVTIDYPEEDLEEAQTETCLRRTREAIEQAERLLKTYKAGRAATKGVNVVIAGRPNEGKSTLLNALVGYERAIVTQEAGTTRDTVEAAYIYNGMMFNVTDTAGLRSDAVSQAEKLGIERSMQAVRGADVVLALSDDAAVHGKTLRVYNKSDLMKERKEGQTIQHVQAAAAGEKAAGENEKSAGENEKRNRGKEDAVFVSAKTGEGIEQLKQRIYESADCCCEGETLLVNMRQYDAVKQCRDCLAAAENALKQEREFELVSVDLMGAINALREVTGVSAAQQVVNSIFARFCVGK